MFVDARRKVKRMKCYHIQYGDVMTVSTLHPTQKNVWGLYLFISLERSSAALSLLPK